MDCRKTAAVGSNRQSGLIPQHNKVFLYYRDCSRLTIEQGKLVRDVFHRCIENTATIRHPAEPGRAGIDSWRQIACFTAGERDSKDIAAPSSWVAPAA